MIEIFSNDYETYTVEYNGKGVSLNQYYSQGHWSQRHGIKKKYKPEFEELIEEVGIPKMTEFGLVIYYNSRHDPDNVIGFEKIFMDCLKEMELIPDDSKHYYKFCAVIPDLDLPNNTFLFNLQKIK